MPSIPESPTSLPVTYKKASGSLPTSGWNTTNPNLITSNIELHIKQEETQLSSLNKKIDSSYFNYTGNWQVKKYGTKTSTSTASYISTINGKKYRTIEFPNPDLTSEKHTLFIDESGNLYRGRGSSYWTTPELYALNAMYAYTISDTSITANTSVKMYLTDEGGVKAQSKANGSITVIRDTVPTTAIPYEYEVEETSAEGLFEVVNAYVPAVPTKTSQLTNDSGFITAADIPSAGEWVDVTGETATLTQAGTYQVIASVNDMQSIVYWDGSTAAYGTKSTAPSVSTSGGTAYLFINCAYPQIDASGTLSVHLLTAGNSSGAWTETNTTVSGFKYRKIN